MDNNTLSIYVHELRNQFTNLQASFDLFNQSIAAKNGQGILYTGGMILFPASQIVSILWPTRARSRGRGEALRKVFQLEEKHVLNDRRLSEINEHSDTKTEEWIAKTKGQQIVFDFVGPRAELDTIEPSENGELVSDENIYRAYDPDTRVYYYRGVAYNMNAIATALADVSGRVNNVYAQMFPEQVKREQEFVAAQRKAIEEAEAAQQAADSAKK
ncbi:hypothetical protein QGN29_00665 [Temperatibacter marinus]|uniref:Uncharacterized protein n=1 Tax=Temperatibacter marinus TaxID=1456591 RepID=A0AA52HAR2_9PROT|nr:hypothetical protein [Temperatibacter marinus]WND02873.1 hypothetical protein QGN29_00665 [Temperatibacter marinus]